MSLPNNAQPEQFEAPDRQVWRQWLEANHACSNGVWLVYYKKHSGKPCVSYEDAVEEALCFGWIDSRANTLDEERHVQFFGPRKAKSPWSRLNKHRIEKLTQQGLMTPAGLSLIEKAQQDGSWHSYDAIEDLAVPDDLQKALAQNALAEMYFEAFSTSVKKQLLWHLASAKRPETRSKRVEQIVQAAAQNKNPLQYTGKKS